MKSGAFLHLLVRQLVRLQLPQRDHACAHMLHCRVALHPFHLNETCTDLVDALPVSSPGRRADELPSGAVLRAFRSVAMHVQGVCVESAAHRTDVPQVPQEGNTLRQSDVLVEARERAVTFISSGNTASPHPPPVPEGAVAKTSRVELAVL